MSERPQILIYANATTPPLLIAAIGHGCEEEGVGHRTEIVSGEAEQLARQAAAGSPLFVGVGIDDRLSAAIHESRLGERQPVVVLEQVSEITARLVGGDAARLVLGRPPRVGDIIFPPCGQSDID